MPQVQTQVQSKTATARFHQTYIVCFLFLFDACSFSNVMLILSSYDDFR